MKTSAIRTAAPQETSDYRLTGANAALAIERGLAEADWYQCLLPRDVLRELSVRRNGPAIRDTLLWFALIAISALTTFALRSSWWFILPYAAYSVLYASTSDSRWHESGHGTAFRTDWMNNALYEIASFMIMRESVVWRWSHSRHHSDTIIVGRDPEIAVPVPPNVHAIIGGFFNLGGYARYFPHIIRHCGGRAAADEMTFIPQAELPKLYRNARIYTAIYLSVICLCLYCRSIFPLLFVGLPNLFGSWLVMIYGVTQHAGLAENVLDHRLNSRTILMNPIHRFLYWNMNYHLEHHMFPLVPFHALHRLHEAVRDDCPTPYPSLFSAWKEIIPTVLGQVKDPSHHVKRKVPTTAKAANGEDAAMFRRVASAQGWVDVCESASLKASDVLRFDCGKKTYAIYRDHRNCVYATDGLCTHGNSHLSNGVVVGATIECPKHNGRFELADGSPARSPVCRALATYPVEETDGKIRVNIVRARGMGARTPDRLELRVVSNRSVATFIKELILEPAKDGNKISFTPGDYLQFDVPEYDEIRFSKFDIPEPYATTWRNQRIFDLVARNSSSCRRSNYSLASNSAMEPVLRFNIRIATPPPGQDCAPGIASAYAFSLKPGDIVTASGPFGDFYIKPTLREMLYVGGGAGMAPIRAHLSHLLETEGSRRRISYWYGARSLQEVFYEDYLREFASRLGNFSFHLALSSPLPEDAWTGPVGYIHEVLFEQYLRDHRSPSGIEYYLCGPPLMIKACVRMITDLGVSAADIAYDEF